MARNRARLAFGAGLVALVLGTGAAAVVMAGRPAGTPATAITIEIRYSHFTPSTITVPVGVPVTITLVNDDPIDHEWIIGDDEVQQKHRTGTELLHPVRPTEQVIPAMSTRVTTITFDAPATWKYICHLPGHEAYGMVGVAAIVR
jgi:plastocyanin